MTHGDQESFGLKRLFLFLSIDALFSAPEHFELFITVHVEEQIRKEQTSIFSNYDKQSVTMELRPILL